MKAAQCAKQDRGPKPHEAGIAASELASDEQRLCRIEGQGYEAKPAEEGYRASVVVLADTGQSGDRENLLANRKVCRRPEHNNFPGQCVLLFVGLVS